MFPRRRYQVFDSRRTRKTTPPFNPGTGVYLDDENHHQLFVPVGFAHGFCVVSDVADVTYKVSSVYDPKTETGLAWNDPDIGVEWPIDEPILSARDVNAESLADYRKRVSQ